MITLTHSKDKQTKLKIKPDVLYLHLKHQELQK